MIQFRSSAKFDKNASILLIDKDQLNKKNFANLRESSLKTAILNLAKTKRFCAAKNETFPLIWNEKIVLLVGLGKKNEASPKALRVAVRNAIQSSFLKKSKDVEFIPHKNTDAIVRAIIDGISIGTYTWKKYQTPPKEDKPVDEKT